MRRRLQRKKTKKSTYHDLIFSFKNVKFDCEIDDSYSDEDKDKIRHIVEVFSRNIELDKSYVAFDQNKHQDAYLLEDGWIKLCQLILDTNYGKKTTRAEEYEINEIFDLLATTYIYYILEMYQYDIDKITLSFQKKNVYSVEFKDDTVNEWKYYPGPWQDWK